MSFVILIKWGSRVYLQGIDGEATLYETKKEAEEIAGTMQAKCIVVEI